MTKKNASPTAYSDARVATAKPTAYSYVRFSSAKQAEGDSLRRQTERAAEYCNRLGLTLDTSLTLRDLGVSAFRGDNALSGNLGVFLDAVKRGTVQAGSVLIVESFDRISRQGIDEGYEIVKRILKADVRIVTLSPEREFDREATRSLSKGALEIQLILERAAEESERKSDRVGSVWAQKRRDAVATGVVMTNRLPAWVECVDGELSLIPDAAAAIRRIFDLAANGYGMVGIIRTLDRERIAPLGNSTRWLCAYLSLILGDRRVLGAYQPKRGRVNDGPEIPNYFPAVVSEDEWLQARASIRKRSHHKGRTSDREVNIFSGLLRNARPPNDAYIMSTRVSASRSGDKTRKFNVLMNAETQNGGRSWSFPYLPFETAFLTWFREVKAGDVLPGNGANDDAAKLAGSLEKVETELADAVAFMDKNGFSPAIGGRVAALESRQRELAADLAEARRVAAHPLGESMGTAQTLADVLAKSTDPRDTRLRLRGALRSVVENMQVLIVRHYPFTLAAVQVAFVGGGVRVFLIHHTTAGNRRAEQCESRSFIAGEAVGVDLRKPKDVAKLEKTLLKLIGGE